MPHFAVTAVGADRPGIVAGLTEALRDVGGNLEDVASTILRGSFTMMLVVSAPQETSSGDLEEALARAATPLGVAVTVRDVQAAAPERPDATHVLTAYGSDRPGIVAGFARLLADRGINITDLSCRLVGAERPVYAMIAELQVPGDTDHASLEEALRETAASLAVDITFRPVEVETL